MLKHNITKYLAKTNKLVKQKFDLKIKLITKQLRFQTKLRELPTFSY